MRPSEMLRQPDYSHLIRCMCYLIFFGCLAINTYAGTEPEIIAAAKSANLHKVEHLLASGADINSVDLLGRTPLFLASGFGHRELIAFLLDKGADANIRDKYGTTPLMEAAKQGREESIKLLLEKREIVTADYTKLSDAIAAAGGKSVISENDRSKKIEIDAIDKKGNTALMWATISNWPKIVGLLFDYGANPHVRNQTGLVAHDLAKKAELKSAIASLQAERDKSRKLFSAIESNDEEEMSRLLEQGYPVNSTIKSGETPLMRAAILGNPKIVELLLNNSAMINAVDHTGQTALMKSAQSGSKEMTALLLNHGSDSDMKSKEGLKAEDYAKKAKHGDVASMIMNFENSAGKLPFAVESANASSVENLLKNGAPADFKKLGKIPVLVIAAKTGSIPVARLLVDKGASLEAADPEGDTPLIAACRECKSDMVSFLLNAGANPDAKDNLGYSVLKTVWDLKLDGGEECAKTFTTLKSHLERTSPGYQLILSAEAGDLSSVVELIQKGVDLDYENELEQTAILVSASEGHTEVVRALQRSGADTSGAVEAASASGKLDTLKFLLESGATLSKGALSKAAASGRRDIVEFLIDKGADVNELFVDEGDYQATPLILASAAGHLEVVQLLLLKGADPLIKDSDDKTAVDLVGGAHGEEITKLLRISDKKKSTAK